MLRDLGGFYNYGRKVYVKLNGLAVGEVKWCVYFREI